MFYTQEFRHVALGEPPPPHFFSQQTHFLNYVYKIKLKWCAPPPPHTLWGIAYRNGIEYKDIKSENEGKGILRTAPVPSTYYAIPPTPQRIKILIFENFLLFFLVKIFFLMRGNLSIEYSYDSFGFCKV